MPGDNGLAEGRWLWRRLYVFANSALAWLVLDGVIAAAPAAAGPGLARDLMGLLGLLGVLYLVAPTAQQLLAGLPGLRSGHGERP
ncbi:hypothetical protein [Brevundimonas kwangchunensis]|uniref:hypothetical protein n=1 Tax=Brevundimonas kwangchunensis TaxID=322163 RepID=UPI0031D631E0